MKNPIISKIKNELSNVIVGQEEVIDAMLMAIVANGHVLVEGVPGTAKSLITKSTAAITGCKFSRIQFTVDLLPSDITGITTISQDKSSFGIIKGPIFSNFVMADEINRAPPKTQSALLEAMGEMQVTIGKKTFALEPPFFVMATQNPVESTGIYPLPEAQLDRFFFKVLIDYPKKEQEEKIIEQNIAVKSFESYRLKKLISPDKIIRMQKEIYEIKSKSKIKKYIVDIVDASRHPKNYGLNISKYIDLGASPRASIYLFVAAKANAFINGDKYVVPQHVKNIAHLVLRHRIKLNYKAKIDNVTPDMGIDEILNKVKVP